MSRNPNTSDDNDFDFYLKHNIPLEQVRSILRHRKMSDDKIENFVLKLSDARSRVQKYARKFIQKLDQRYGIHDVPTIVKKAAKFAERHELTHAERDAVIDMAMKGDVSNTFNLANELEYSEMSKFMGITSTAGQVLNLQSKDYATLNEIVKLYEQSRVIHLDIKNQLSLYRDCAPEAITGAFDRTKHNLSIHIHPVIVAMFLPKVACLERRMLCANIGRIVLQRSLPYINRHITLYDNVMPMELETEWELTCDIVNDPNSLAYFSDDTPVSNMMKRFKIQVELWRNVLHLRSGRYYSIAGSYEADDGITGLLRILSAYDWSFFDSPEMFHIQDEGSVLRKLLAVFSLRPTFAKITSVINKSFMGYNPYTGYARTTFMRIPIINVRLLSQLAQATNMPAMHLNRALNQDDFFIEHKTIVPKNKSVLFSNQVLFFYANRRFQSINTANLSVRFNYTAIPYQTWNIGQTAINSTNLDFDDVITSIGNIPYNIRSVVTVYRPPVSANITVGSSAAVGSSTIVVKYDGGGAPTDYLYYNPLLANYLIPTGTSYISNPPISAVSYQMFRDMASKYGTIFMYTSN